MHEETPEESFFSARDVQILQTQPTRKRKAAPGIPVNSHKKKKDSSIARAERSAPEAFARCARTKKSQPQQHAVQLQEGSVGLSEDATASAAEASMNAGSLAQPQEEATAVAESRVTRSHSSTHAQLLLSLRSRLSDALDDVTQVQFRMSALNKSPSTRQQVSSNEAEDTRATQNAEDVLEDANSEDVQVLLSQYGTTEVETTKLNRCSVCLAHPSNYVFECGHPVCEGCVARLGSDLAGCACCPTKTHVVITLQYLLQK